MSGPLETATRPHTIRVGDAGDQRIHVVDPEDDQFPAAYTTVSRSGVRLRIPVLPWHGGTLTLGEYRAWDRSGTAGACGPDRGSGPTK